MSSEDESLPKEGPSMPEDAESMTADVVDGSQIDIAQRLEHDEDE